LKFLKKIYFRSKLFFDKFSKLLFYFFFRKRKEELYKDYGEEGQAALKLNEA
jgi:hypothetical protein